MQLGKSPLRILITPNYRSPYDQRMVKGLADGFTQIGHHARALPSPVSTLELAKMCESLSINVVIQVNRARDPDTPLPPNVRHISWFQDVFPQTLDGFEEGFLPGDILYALGDPGVLGLNVQLPCYVGSLMTGVDSSVINFRAGSEASSIDFSLCGYIPPPFVTTPSIRTDVLWYWDNLIKRTPVLGRSKLLWVLRKLLFRRHLPVNYVPYAALLTMMDIVEGVYRPLRGELDIHELSFAMRKNSDLYEGTFSKLPLDCNKPQRRSSRLSMLLKPYAQRYAGRSDLKSLFVRYLVAEKSLLQADSYSPFDSAINYFAQTYPRMLDRVLLINQVLSISESVELYGPGWDAHAAFQPFHKGIVDDQSRLLDIYRRSKINLANNTHGLGLHSRTLECMAVGGFVLTHESPHDNKPGGMLTAFEPGVHYGAFTPENLKDEAKRWLKDKKARKQIGINASDVIRKNHAWHHRAKKIADDLKE